MTPLAQDAAKGFILGLSIAAPVGPIGLLCIRRALERGALAGIASGLGTAAADAAYAAVAAFGVTAVSASLAAEAMPLQAAGIAVLMALGIKTFCQAPAGASQEAAHTELFVQTFFLTLTNPTTILSFAVVFAGLGLVSSGSPARAAALVAGTFAGSLAWWIVLSMTVSVARGWMSPRVTQWINRGAGILLMGFAATLAIKLL